MISYYETSSFADLNRKLPIVSHHSELVVTSMIQISRRQSMSISRVGLCILDTYVE